MAEAPFIGFKKDPNPLMAEILGKPPVVQSRPSEPTVPKSGIPNSKVPSPLAKPVVLDPANGPVQAMITFEESSIFPDGFADTAYLDTKKKWTIGNGYNLEQPGARAAITALGLDYDAVLAKKQTITKAQSNILFQKALKGSLASARGIFPGFDSMSSGRQATLLDTVYNFGAENLIASFPSYIDAANAGDWDKAAFELMHNTKGDGPSVYALEAPNRAGRNEAALRTGNRPDIPQAAPPQAVFGVATSRNPDNEVEVQKLAFESGLPQPIVRDHFEPVSQMKGTISFEKAIMDHPAIREALSDPDTLAIAHDDIPNLVMTAEATKEMSLSTAIGRGVDVVQSLGFRAIEATGEAVGSETLTDIGAAGAEFNEAQMAASGNRSQFVDIRSAGDFGQWFKETVGEQLPIMGPTFVGMGVGMAAGSVIPGVGTVLGGIIGAFIPSFVLGVGETQAQLKENDPNAVASGLVFGAGTLIGTLDSALPGKIGSTLVKAFGVDLAELVVKEIGIATVKAGGKTATLEGVTEAIQQVIGNAASTLGADQTIDVENLTNGVIESFAAGFFMGGSTGVVVETSSVAINNYRAARSQKAIMDRMNAAAAASKVSTRNRDKYVAFGVSVLEDRGITEVSVPAAQIMGYAENHAGGPAKALAGLGIDPAALTKALENNDDMTFSAEAFVKNILGTPAYENMANNLRMMRGQETVNESVIHLIDQAAVLNTNLAAEDVTPNLRARTQQLLDAFTAGDPVAAAEELQKALPDVISTVDSLIAKATEHKTGVEEVVKKGRLRALHSAIVDLDQQIVNTSDDIDAAITGGRATVALNQKLEALQNLRAKADAEAANISFPSRVPVSDAASAVLEQPVDKEVVKENEQLNQEIEDLKAKREDAKLDLDRAQMMNDKGRMASIAGYIKRLNKHLRALETKLADNVADHKPLVSPRNQSLELKALTLDKLKVTITAEKIRAVREAFRAGIAEARKNIKDIQSIVVRLIKDSGMSLHEQGKFLSTLKNIQTSAELTKQLGVLQSRMLVALQTEQRAQLNAAIKTVLKSAKADKRGKHPIGHLTPETQDMMDEAKEIWGLTIEAAQERLASLKADAQPTPMTRTKGMMLAIRAESANAVSNQDVEQVLFDLQEIVEFGTALGKLRSFKRLHIQQTDIAAADIAVTDSKPIEGEATIGFMKRLGRAYRNTQSQYAGAWMAWRTVLETLFKIDPALVNRLKMTKELQRVKGRLIKWQARWDQIGMDAYGFDDQRQMMDKHHDDNVKHDLGLHKNLNYEKTKKMVRLEYSVAEARKLWMEMQDPTIAEAYMSEAGNAYTLDMVQAILKMVGARDIVYAEAQLQFYREIYQDINEVYRDIYGVNMPYNDMYSPISRDMGAVSDDRSLTQAATITIADEMSLRRSIPSGIVSRKQNSHPLQKRGDVGAMYRHLHDMAHFIETSRKVMHLKGVFSNPQLQKDITFHHGKSMMRLINGFLEDFGVGYAHRGVLFEEMIGNANRRFAQSVLAIKPVIGAKQLTSYFALADDMPSEKFAQYSLEFLKSPKILGRMLYDSSVMLQHRGSSIDFEIAKVGSSTEMLFDPKRGIPVEHLLMSFIRLGDRAPIYVGGYAKYRYATAPVSEGGLGLTHQEGIDIFEEAVNDTQQSNDLDQQTALQRSGAIGRSITLFMTARLALLRGELRVIKNRPKMIGGTGQITWRQFGERMAYYHFIMPMMIQWLASGYRWETDKQIQAMMMGQLNTFVLFGDVMYDVVADAVSGETNWIRDTGVPLFDIMKDVGKGVSDAINSTNVEDILNSMGELNKAAGELLGLPLDAARKFVYGGVKFATGDFREGFTMMTGLSETVAKEAAEGEFDPFRD